jgi:phosphoglycolate phosphatase
MPAMSANAWRLLVFDWDGTLMDSIAAIVACTHRAVADSGLEPPPERDIRHAVGMGLRDSMERFFPGVDEALCARMVAAYRRHWLESFKDEPRLFAGSVEALRRLHAAGYLIAIATAKGRQGLMRELARTELEALVVATRTVDECLPKPHPAMLLDLMAELGTTCDSTLMIGDTLWDLEMARNAGVRSVAVLSGGHGREVLLGGGPLACLDGVADLPGWLAAPRATAAAAS